MERYLLLVLMGIAGGLLAHRLNVPGGAVVGAMLLSGLTAMFLPGGVHLPPRLGLTIQILLGISLGMTFDRGFVDIALKALPLAVFSTLILLAVALCMAWIASRLGLVDFGTALFGFSPGGFSGMAILAQAEGHKTSIVAFCHTVRIFTLFLLVPLMVRVYLYLHNRP